jgi:hypothetical protein
MDTLNPTRRDVMPAGEPSALVFDPALVGNVKQMPTPSPEGSPEFWRHVIR